MTVDLSNVVQIYNAMGDDRRRKQKLKRKINSVTQLRRKK